MDTLNGEPNGGKAITTGGVLRALPIGCFITIRKIEAGGALQARKLKSGAVRFYWRYTHEGFTDRVAIGVYDSTAAPRSVEPSSKGYSVAAAAVACQKLAQVQAEKVNEGGYRAHVAAVKRAKDEEKAAAASAGQRSLAKLLDAYCDYLQASGRRSHADARSIFNLHVKKPWPALADAQATAITTMQVTDMLRRLIDSEKGRTANKLRAYLRAAYQCAQDVTSLGSIPAAFKIFEVTRNPVALTKRTATYDRADKRPLPIAELRAYWKAIKRLDGVMGAALRLHLLTGGQRIEQLVRLRREDVSTDKITIFDAKGRPGGQGPRPHVLPLLPAAREALTALSKSGKGEFVISTDQGETHVSAVTLAGWARTAAADIEGFQLKRVRSGVETVLAACGVSRDIRGQLQSHGLTGVQARHYDGHDYLAEKLHALQQLLALLERRAKAGTAHP